MNMDSFYPPMVGSFLGVISAFGLNHLYQLYNNNESKKKYKNMIKSEIEESINLLGQDWIRLLPVDKWNSAVNSGALKLFKSEVELGPLSTAYQNIKEYNFIIEREHFSVYPWERLEYEDGNRLPIITVRRFLRSRDSLRDELIALKNAEWLT